MTIRRKPGWWKSHYYDSYGLSWCYRWRGHGQLSDKWPDHPTPVCKDCADKLFRFKRKWRNFKSWLKFRIGQFCEHLRTFRG